MKKDIDGKELEIGDIIIVPVLSSLSKAVYLGETDKSLIVSACRSHTTTQWNKVGYFRLNRSAPIEQHNKAIYIWKDMDVMFLEKYKGENTFIKNRLYH